MKFDVTIKDLTEEQFVELHGKLFKSSQPIVEVTKVEVDLPEIKDDETVTTTSDELDSNGLPWDERIHTSTKTQNKDGSWKYKRGLDDAEKMAVENELKTAQINAQLPEGVQPVEQTAENTVVPQASPSIVHMPQADEPAPAVAIAPQPSPVQTDLVEMAQATTPTQVEVTPATFESVLARINSLSTQGKINFDFVTTTLQELNTAYGVQMSNIMGVKGNQHMIDYINDKLSAVE